MSLHTWKTPSVYLALSFVASPQSILDDATAAVHAQLHLSDPKMYLFDLEANPSESVEAGCGTDKTLGPPASCGNLYSIPAFRKMRLKLEAILDRADQESVAPTLRWMDDGPLADPLNFGGWVPWRDRNGDPLAHYEGLLIEGTAEEEQDASQPWEPKRVGQTSLAEIGVRGVEEEDVAESYAITVTAAHASGLALFFAIIAVGGTFVAYRAGQRSGYHLLR